MSGTTTHNSDFIIQTDNKNVVLSGYFGSGGEVEVPKGITHIIRSFYSLESITKVIIPEGVKVIGEWSFFGCKNLKSIVIPNSVQKIGACAFHSCEKLQYIDLPEGLLMIGVSAFNHCNNLETIVLPNSLVMLGKNAFANCTGLSHIVMGDSIREFGAEVFLNNHCDVFIPHWSKNFTNAVQNCSDIRIHTQDKLSEIPPDSRIFTLLGFLSEKDMEQDSERALSYFDYMKRNAGKLCDFAFEHPALLYYLCENKLIKAKDYDLYMNRAILSQSTELKALLLNYQNILGMKSIIKARELKEKKRKAYSFAAERADRNEQNQGISGITFVISGRLSSIWRSRTELEKYVEKYGARIEFSVTNRTDYLVTVNDEEKSEKVNKAKQLGIPILSKEDFNHMVGKRFKRTEHIIVPSWLTKIPDHACDYSPVLKEVVISEGVKFIGDYAFFQCDNLTKITIASSVEHIGSMAIARTKALTIFAPAGSFAEQFAKKNGNAFEALKEQDK